MAGKFKMAWAVFTKNHNLPAGRKSPVSYFTFASNEPQQRRCHVIKDAVNQGVAWECNEDGEPVKPDEGQAAEGSDQEADTSGE